MNHESKSHSHAKQEKKKSHSHQDNGHKHTKMPWDYILAGRSVKMIQKSCIEPKRTN